MSVLFHFRQLYDDKMVECYQYYTIRESKIYNITLRSYLGEITTSMEEMISKVIDSVSFGGMNQNSIIYEDEERGVVFHLAEGWNKVVNTKEEQYVQAQYMHTNELGESIQFFCMDLWGNMNTLCHSLSNKAHEPSPDMSIPQADTVKARKTQCSEARLSFLKTERNLLRQNASACKNNYSLQKLT